MKLNAPRGKIEIEAIARRQVFRKLVEALLFEGVLEARTDGDGSNARCSNDEETYGEAGTNDKVGTYDNEEICGKEGVYEKVETYIIDGTDWLGNRVSYSFKGRKAFSFGMIRMEDSAVTRSSFNSGAVHIREAVSIALFLEETVEARHPTLALLPSFIVELEETVRKEAQWIEARGLYHDGSRRLLGLSLTELEGISTDGHPYHPCYKSRIGFTPQQNRSYGPEFQPDIRLFWLAAHCDELIWNVEDRCGWHRFLEKELAREDRERFRGQLKSLGLRVDDYACIPVHPWQWSYLQEKHSELFANHRLIPLGYGSDRYRPQQSIRTLTCVSGEGRGDVKLSLGIVNTSSMRHLTVQSTVAAPAVSAWLQKVADADPYLRESRLILLHEYAGISFPAAGGALGAIWRENVHRYLEPGEEAVPFFTLTAIEAAGMPFIAPWITRYGMGAWFGQLLRRCVIPTVHLLVAHGIVLESHGQNMLLVHRDGLPERVALRDFHEGVEYYEPFLASPEWVPEFGLLHPAYAGGKPGDFFEMGGLQDLSEMLMDALWFMNIGTIITFAARQFPVEERELWTIVASELEAYKASFPELAERFASLRLFAPSYAIEPLVQRRMFGSIKLPPRPAPNPLYECMKIDNRNQGENLSCSQ